MITILLVALIGYLLGSIPSGVWIGKTFRGIDIREHGSKSIGATNVFRVLGAKLAIAVLLIDIAKGFFSCLIASKINLGDILLSPNQLAIIGGLFAIIGHLFPLYAGFRGGKGVAAGAGMLLFLAPLEIAFALIVFAITLALTRYVSLGSILATLFFSISIIFQKYARHYPLGNEMVGLALFLLLLILFTHRANINRLLHGKENKLGTRIA
jgi:acyl phosphate:glycerol-3-phosphate acyltransferase